MANTDWTRTYAKTGWASRSERRERSRVIRKNMKIALNILAGKSEEVIRIRGVSGRFTFSVLSNQ